MTLQLHRRSSQGQVFLQVLQSFTCLIQSIEVLAEPKASVALSYMGVLLAVELEFRY